MTRKREPRIARIYTDGRRRPILSLFIRGHPFHPWSKIPFQRFESFNEIGRLYPELYFIASIGRGQGGRFLCFHRQERIIGGMKTEIN